MFNKMNKKYSKEYLENNYDDSPNYSERDIKEAILNFGYEEFTGFKDMIHLTIEEIFDKTWQSANHDCSSNYFQLIPRFETIISIIRGKAERIRFYEKKVEEEKKAVEKLKVEKK